MEFKASERSKGLKLTCPVCRKDFVTTHPNKIYCDPLCGLTLQDIKKRIKENESKQASFASKRLFYDFDRDTFFAQFKEW